ncbi:MAG: NUMOD4 motif-containing HNH endonuclease [bacterium]
MNTINETWRAVPGFEGFYSVSTMGRVRRDRKTTSTQAGRILRAVDRGNGYPFVQLCRDGSRRSESVHRIVAAAFLGPCPPGCEVNHINGMKADPRVVNLEYATSSSNQVHAFRTGLQSCAGERNGQAKLTPAIVLEIRSSATGRRGERVAFARRYGVNEATIRDILSRRTWPDL